MKTKVFYGVMVAILAVLIMSTVSILSLPQSTSAASGGGVGNWKYVCCGDCPYNQDYCVGTGTAICCKSVPEQ